MRNVAGEPKGFRDSSFSLNRGRAATATECPIPPRPPHLARFAPRTVHWLDFTYPPNMSLSVVRFAARSGWPKPPPCARGSSRLPTKKEGTVDLRLCRSSPVPARKAADVGKHEVRARITNPGR